MTGNWNMLEFNPELIPGKWRSRDSTESSRMVGNSIYWFDVLEDGDGKYKW
jgi:hypothetical protein